MLRLLSVSYTHLRAHETVLDLVCRLLLEKKNTNDMFTHIRKSKLDTTSDHVCIYVVVLVDICTCTSI